jgi:membrane protease YdiL (CAAX protease family)
LENKEFESNTLLRWSLTRPLLVSTGLFTIALVIRLIDSIVLRLDERLGELILTKSLGFILVLVFVWLAGRKVRDIGLHSSFLRQSLVLGAGVTVVAFCFGYGVEILLAMLSDIHPVVSFAAIDSKLGVTGGVWFGAWMLFCNVVNSFMEEGLFRGVIGRLSRIRFGFWGANWFQAAMFSIWHLPWVLKYYLVGDIHTGGDLVQSVLFHSLPQLLIGLVYGYFYLKTGSLWAPWIAHALSNSVLNFLHVTTTDGFDSGLPVRMVVNLVVMFIGLLWVKRQAEANKMREVQPWA